MFCNGCGQDLEPGQHFCSKCGQPVGVAAIPRRLNRVAEHSKLLGVLWIVYSLFHVLGGFALLLIANEVLAHIASNMGGAEFPSFIQPLLSAVAIFLFVKGALGLAAGVGLLQRASWARMLALVVGFISLLNIPIGTALGIYTLWVLLSTDSEKEYSGLARAA